MIRICLVGIGNTGKEVARYFLEQNEFKLVAAVCSPESPKKGRDLGEIIGTRDTGIIIDSSENIEEMVFRTKPDIAVDFSGPDATLKNARIFSRLKVNMVVATTGFSKLGLKKLFVLTRKYHNGIVYAPNITLGVNVLMVLSNIASSILNNYDFQLMEIHHKRKKDAPSGTALKIAQEIEKGLLSSGKQVRQEDIPITAIRAGGMVSRHEVMIIGEEDKIEITHEAFSRKAFAAGAARAARFLYKRTGYFEMSDVLDLGKALAEYLDKQGNSLNRRYNGQISINNTDPEESFA